VRVPYSSDDSRLWLLLERRDGEAHEVRAHLSSLPDWIGRRRLVYLLKCPFPISRARKGTADFGTPAAGPNRACS
jgi:hypothetical protein